MDPLIVSLTGAVLIATLFAVIPIALDAISYRRPDND